MRTPLQAGDRVRFVNERLEGTVKKIISGIAYVATPDDFEIPVHVNELVKIDFESGSTQVESSAQPVTPVKSNLPPGCYLAFDADTNKKLSLSVFNSRCDVIGLTFYECSGGIYTYKKSIEIKQHTQVEMGTYDLQSLEKWPTLVFQCHIIQYVSDKKPVSEVYTWNARPSSFFDHYRFAYFVNKQVYLFQLDAWSLPEEKRNQLAAFPIEQEVAPSPTLTLNEDLGNVFDLHIEKLVSNKEQYTPAEMLDIQLQAAREYIDKSYAGGMDSIILIHGIGNSVLKNRIQKHVNSIKHIVKSIKNADIHRYGNGATEIRFL